MCLSAAVKITGDGNGLRERLLDSQQLELFEDVLRRILGRRLALAEMSVMGDAPESAPDADLRARIERRIRELETLVEAAMRGKIPLFSLHTLHQHERTNQ